MISSFASCFAEAGSLTASALHASVGASATATVTITAVALPKIE